jgi:hypothetical protein
MKAAEILRKLADMIDQHSDQGEDANPNSEQHKELAPVEANISDESDSSVMVPPLQAKIEILKKATGIASYYDNDTEEMPDELSRIKQNAGIQPVIIHIASDDEPLDV